jgi:hypothetical protein
MRKQLLGTAFGLALRVETATPALDRSELSRQLRLLEARARASAKAGVQKVWVTGKVLNLRSLPPRVLLTDS